MRTEINGELTIYTVAEWKPALLGLLDAGHGGDAELGLAGVTEFDTAGLQLLLVLWREAARTGTGLRLTAPSRAVTDVLAIAHLTTDLDDAGVVRPEEALQ